MSLVLIPKIADRREHWIRSRLSQAAVRGLFYMLAQLLQSFDILHLPFSLDDSIQNIEHHLHPDSARNTFAAGFIDRKVSEESGCIDHAGRIVHDDQTPRAHHRPGFIERVKIDLCI